MSESAKEIFTKLAAAEQPALFRDLEKFRVELICKLPGQEEIIRLSTLAYDSASVLSCVLQSGSELPADLPQSAVISFVLGEDRFFLTTKLTHTQGAIYALSVSVDIFKLQRRQSYRLRIPESSVAKAQLTKIRDVTVKIPSRLLDLSTGGLRLTTKSAGVDAQIGDRVEGSFSFGARSPLDFRAIVRHVRLETKPSQPSATLGLEFEGLTPALEGRLFGLTMELHREFFSSRNER